MYIGIYIGIYLYFYSYFYTKISKNLLKSSSSETGVLRVLLADSTNQFQPLISHHLPKQMLALLQYFAQVPPGQGIYSISIVAVISTVINTATAHLLPTKSITAFLLATATSSSLVSCFYSKHINTWKQIELCQLLQPAMLCSVSSSTNITMFFHTLLV